MSFSIALDLKDAIKAKVHMCWLRIIKIKMVIPAKSTVKAFVDIPDLYNWLMIGDVHDVPAGVFKHGCIKDGFVAFEPMIIDGDNMVLYYAIPWLAERYVEGTFINTTDTDQTFILSVFIANLPRLFVEQLKREIAFEEELKSLIIELWEKASAEEKREFVKLWMRRAPEMLTKMVS